MLCPMFSILTFDAFSVYPLPRSCFLCLMLSPPTCPPAAAEATSPRTPAATAPPRPRVEAVRGGWRKARSAYVRTCVYVCVCVYIYVRTLELLWFRPCSSTGGRFHRGGSWRPCTPPTAEIQGDPRALLHECACPLFQTGVGACVLPSVYCLVKDLSEDRAAAFFFRVRFSRPAATAAPDPAKSSKDGSSKRSKNDGGEEGSNERSKGGGGGGGGGGQEEKQDGEGKKDDGQEESKSSGRQEKGGESLLSLAYSWLLAWSWSVPQWELKKRVETV